jgi:serine/threonine-protein kinase RsbW
LQGEFVNDNVIVRLDLTMPGDAASLCPVVDRVLRVLNAAGYTDDAHEIELALREALANAVTHGTKNNPSKPIRCTVECDVTRGVLIVVQDSGEGFELDEVPDCLSGENLFADHGRGIYLIGQLMDEVRFEHGGTEIHMIKRRRNGTPPAPRDPLA